MTKSFKRELLFTLLIAYLMTSIIFLAYGFKVIADDKTDELPETKIVYVHDMPETKIQTETKTKTVTKYVPITQEPQPETLMTDADKELLAQVVHAEAGNQDDIGRRLVADVVLNRMDSSRFPDTVEEVISQDNQFKTGLKYTDADMDAVEAELQSRLDHNVIWFRTGSYHKIGNQLYQHGDHYFSGR